MTRIQFDRAIEAVKDLRAQLDVLPRPLPLQRERIVKSAITILQTIADDFDTQRA